jgi:hypothetical protein
MLMVAAAFMMPGAVIAIGRPVVAVMGPIWVCLGKQGIQGQDQAHHQDNTQPSSQVHELSLREKISAWIC